MRRLAEETLLRRLTQRDRLRGGLIQNSSRDPAGSVPLLPILTVNFIGTLGFSIVLPFLVFLVTKWGGNALIYGVMGATYSLFQLVGAPLMGRWSDVYGRKKILLMSQLGTLASWLIFLSAFFLPHYTVMQVDSELIGTFAISLPLVALFIGRATDGLTGGNISVANAYLADVSSDENRSSNFGKMAISSNLGFIVGPALAGVLGATILGEILPVIAAVVISLVASLIIAIKLPESLPCVLDIHPEGRNVRKVFGHEQKECVPLQGAAHLSARQLLHLQGIPWLLAIYFLVMLGFHVFYVGFPIYAINQLRWAVTDTGIFFSTMGLLMVVVQGPVLTFLSKRMVETALIRGGSLILALGFFCFNSLSTATIYSGVALMAFGNGIMWPSVLSLLAKRAGAKYQGAVQGFAGSTGAVASIVGLLTAGIAYGALQGRVFWIAGGVILIVFLMATISLGKHPNRDEALG